MNDIYDESAEDATEIVALLDAQTSDGDALLDAWFEWATTPEDADVVLRLWDYVDGDFQALILTFVEDEYEACSDDYATEENPWLELWTRLKAAEPSWC